MPQMFLVIEDHTAEEAPHVIISVRSVPAIRGFVEWTEELRAWADRRAKALLPGAPLRRKELEILPPSLHYERLDNGKDVTIVS